MSPSEIRAKLESQQRLLHSQIEELQLLADAVDPPTKDELTQREIQADDDALWRLAVRVYDTVKEHPGIEAKAITSSMGLPSDYPDVGANYFTMQLLKVLEDRGMVYADRTVRPFEWAVCQPDQPPERPKLILVK